MAVGDVYELTDHQTYLSQEVANRYHFRNVGVSGTAEDCALAYVTDILPSLLPLQDDLLEHVRISVINYDDPTDYHEEALVGSEGTSALGGDALPSFVAFRLRILRSSREIRNGSKRYAGLNEGQVNQNTLVAGEVVKLETLASALEQQITAPLGGTFSLVLYGHITPNRPAPIVVPVAGVQALSGVTTQNSRKVWVGT